MSLHYQDVMFFMFLGLAICTACYSICLRIKKDSIIIRNLTSNIRIVPAHPVVEVVQIVDATTTRRVVPDIP